MNDKKRVLKGKKEKVGGRKLQRTKGNSTIYIKESSRGLHTNGAEVCITLEIRAGCTEESIKRFRAEGFDMEEICNEEPLHCIWRQVPQKIPPMKFTLFAHE